MTLHPLIQNLDVVTEAPGGVEALRVLIIKLAANGRLSRSDHEIHPETGLPESWKLMKFGDLVEFSMGKTPPTKDAKFWAGADSTMWVSIGDMVDGGEVRKSQRSVSRHARRDIFRREPWPAGTLLMSFKLTIGKVTRLGVPGYFNEAIISFKSDSRDLDEYLFRVLPVLAATGDSRGAIKGNTLNSKSISDLRVPVPPDEELSRVTSQIDYLASLCRRLDSELEKRDSIARRFADSVIAAS